MELHNTAIKKDASEIFELNAFDKPMDSIKEDIQPVVEVKPYTQFILSDNNTSTLLDASSGYFKNRSVYITGMRASGDSSTSNSIQIAFVLANKSNPSVYHLGSAANANESTWDFGERGLLLDKNNAQAVNIVVNAVDVQATVEIWGYVGSDRS